MRHLLEIAQTGLASVLLHRLRSLVCVAALLAVLLPYLVGLAISKGVEAEADASVRFGADLYVSGQQFGRPVPIPLKAEQRIRDIDNVTAVVPRIVGEVTLGNESAILVGLPPEQIAAWTDTFEGDVPKAATPNVPRPHELVLGTTLARRLKARIGTYFRPFPGSRGPARTLLVVGLFKPDAPLWQSRLILTTFETAANVFGQKDLATDLLVSCRPGYQADIVREIDRLSFPNGGGLIQTRVTAREDLLALFPRTLLHREGIFTLHFVLAFVVGILVLLVTSGVGLSERRREVGILKATGWQTDEVLLRSLTESFALSIAGACVALLLAWGWLRFFNGYWIASLFLDGAGTTPEFPVPFELAPVPILLAFVLSFVIVLTGTLYSTWRAAIASPLEAMR
jgi:ABC-type lipoprotein release transport system permease subunit